MQKPLTLEEFQEEIAKLNRWAHHGCGDGHCQIKTPQGMHTNGGCRCRPQRFSETLLWLAEEAEKHGRQNWPIKVEIANERNARG